MSLNFDEFNSVVKIFEKQSSMLQDQPYLWRKFDDKYSSLSWKEVRSNVEKIFYFFKKFRHTRR